MVSPVLKRVYASGGSEQILLTLEIKAPSFPEPICLVQDFQDWTMGTEDGRTLTFRGVAFDYSRQKNDASGKNTLKFAIDNISGEAQEYIELAMNNREKITVIAREYLDSDISAPQRAPVYMEVQGAQISGSAVQIECGQYNILNTRWPRRIYSSEFAPGLRFL